MDVSQGDMNTHGGGSTDLVVREGQCGDVIHGRKSLAKVRLTWSIGSWIQSRTRAIDLVVAGWWGGKKGMASHQNMKKFQFSMWAQCRENYGLSLALCTVFWRYNKNSFRDRMSFDFDTNLCSTTGNQASLTWRIENEKVLINQKMIITWNYNFYKFKPSWKIENR